MTKVEKPWGYYIEYARHPQCVLKSLVIFPGQSISYQLHHYRDEIWAIVEGQGFVTLDDKDIGVAWNNKNKVEIKAGQKHRVTNTGVENLVIYEMQTGELCVEDDIIRIEDKYKRV